MDMMDYLYNDEIIMRNYNARLIRESEARGEARGISIGRNEGISIGRNNILAEMLANGEITAAQAAKYSGA